MQPIPTRDHALLTLRLAALLGLAIATYLLFLSTTGQTAYGCGEGEAGCNAVLASRWSKLLGYPVSIPAIAAYTLILAVSLHAGPRTQQQQRDNAWRLLGFLGLAAGLSALWFIAVQLFILKGLCLYCMSAHACSLVIAGITLTRSRGILPRLGVLPAAALISLQLTTTPPPPPIDNNSAIIDNLDPHAAPTLGDPDAPHLIGLVFDYNCAFCRDTHRMAKQAVTRYGTKLTVVLYPTAQNAACNPYVQHTNPHSETSCDLARLALAVWLAKPAAFREYDTQLIELAEAHARSDETAVEYLANARALAEQFVPAEELELALADPRIDAILSDNARLYALATYHGRRGVPRLILNGRARPGLPDQQTLHDLIEQAYPDLKPTQ